MILLAGPESKGKEPIQDVIWEEVEDAIRKLPANADIGFLRRTSGGNSGSNALYGNQWRP